MPKSWVFWPMVLLLRKTHMIMFLMQLHASRIYSFSINIYILDSLLEGLQEFLAPKQIISIKIGLNMHSK